MHPYFEVLGREIPAYWVCALAGALASSILLLIRHRNFKELRQVDITNSAALAVVGMIVGARLLFVLTILPAIVKNWDVVTSDWQIMYEVLSNGMVFYGGLFGAIVALHWYFRKYKLDAKRFYDYMVPAFPLFHAFGRVGCFMTGCCHGKECAALGVTYTHSIASENGVPYFPVQLLGAALELALCVIVILYERKHRGEGKAIRLYLAIYAVGRFAIEFLRGDSVRGIWFGLSTSQWISIALVVVLLAARIKKPPAPKGSPEQEARDLNL